MAHFAKINSDNIVEDIIVVSNDVITVDNVENENLGIEFCKVIHGEDTNWIQCSYNNNFRHIYPQKGSEWRADIDKFILEQPFPSWTLDSEYNWQPPIPYPEEINDKKYLWNENLYQSDNTLGWVENTD
jgi:hypothetical protein